MCQNHQTFFTLTQFSHHSGKLLMPAAQRKLSWLHSWLVQTLHLSSSSIWKFCPSRCTFIGPNKLKSVVTKSRLSGWLFMIFHPIVDTVTFAKLLQVDVHYHAVGWYTVTVSPVFSSEFLGAVIMQQVTIILCVNCYTIWKKINMSHSWIIKHTCHDLAIWQLCLEFFGW
jgi:hypothetical protein